MACSWKSPACLQSHSHSWLRYNDWARHTNTGGGEGRDGESERDLDGARGRERERERERESERERRRRRGGGASRLALRLLISIQSEWTAGADGADRWSPRQRKEPQIRISVSSCIDSQLPLLFHFRLLRFGACQTELFRFSGVLDGRLFRYGQPATRYRERLAGSHSVVTGIKQ